MVCRISKTLCRFVKAVEEGRRVGGLRSGEDEGTAEEVGRGFARAEETRGSVQEQGTRDSMGQTRIRDGIRFLEQDFAKNWF